MDTPINFNKETCKFLEKDEDKCPIFNEICSERCASGTIPKMILKMVLSMVANEKKVNLLESKINRTWDEIADNKFSAWARRLIPLEKRINDILKVVETPLLHIKRGKDGIEDTEIVTIPEKEIGMLKTIRNQLIHWWRIYIEKEHNVSFMVLNTLLRIMHDSDIQMCETCTYYGGKLKKEKHDLLPEECSRCKDINKMGDKSEWIDAWSDQKF